jgi:hypothetical protein
MHPHLVTLGIQQMVVYSVVFYRYSPLVEMHHMEIVLEIRSKVGK